MATVLTSPVAVETIQRDTERRELVLAAGAVSVLTLLAVAVHGYHPYAEDGGLYVPEIKRLLRPELYPHGAEFVVGHLRFSAFAPLIAGMVRATHMSVETGLLLVYVASFWWTLFAGWMLAKQCFRSREAQWGAVGLLAAWITMPIAGTSLMLMDPYVTARSLSTPCSLLALVGTLKFVTAPRGSQEQRRGVWLCCGGLIGAAAMHPLMAGYGFGCVAVLLCLMLQTRWIRVWGTAMLCGIALAVAAMMQMTAAPESVAYKDAALTRYYWFLSQWKWYELIGLAAPLSIVAAAGFSRRWFDIERDGKANQSLTRLCRMAVVVGISAVVVAALFARTQLDVHEVARLQPLRIFQMVYVVMILVVGGALGEWVLRRRMMRWVAVFSLLAGVMVMTARRTFPASPHLELPWTEASSRNAWVRAFEWIRKNTPEGAVFAIDSHYIVSRDEDAQGFRAIAERSVLPDYSKDGGVVANKPALGAEWMQGQSVQANLNTESDAERNAALRPLGVSWVVLHRSAETAFRCDYANETVKVCQLP